MFNPGTQTWAGERTGLGKACICLTPYRKPDPSNVLTIADLGMVECSMRTRGGIQSQNVERVMVPLGALVLACDWLLSDTAGQTIRGCPVPSGNGSPFGVALRSPDGQTLLAGSSLEVACPNPELYLRGRDKMSVLVIGFYCCKRQDRI